MSDFLNGTELNSTTHDDTHVMPVVNNVGMGSDAADNDAMYSSWIMQRIHPERQALSEEELAALLRHDELDVSHIQGDADGEMGATSQKLNHPVEEAEVKDVQK